VYVPALLEKIKPASESRQIFPGTSIGLNSRCS
jgi:hypothetical protein